MNIQSAKYIQNFGAPALELKIDGHQAIVSDIKPSTLKQGYVYLSTNELDFSWENKLDPVNINSVSLSGFTNDSRIVQMAKDFNDAINEENGKTFSQRDVEIPKL